MVSIGWIANTINLKNILLSNHHIYCSNGSSYLLIQMYLVPIKWSTNFVCSFWTCLIVRLFGMKFNCPKQNIPFERAWKVLSKFFPKEFFKMTLWIASQNTCQDTWTLLLGQPWDKLFLFQKIFWDEMTIFRANNFVPKD